MRARQTRSKMKILFLTNFYPPYELGGQELSCEQVVLALRARGHSTFVLTSDHGVKRGDFREEYVNRTLQLEMNLQPLRHAWAFFFSRKKKERRSLRQLRKAVHEFQPDIIFIWGMWNLPRSLPFLAETLLPGRVVYRFAEYWPTLPTQHELYWQAPGRIWCMAPLKKVLGALARFRLSLESSVNSLKFERAFCVSASTRNVLLNSGIPLEQAKVIYTGVDPDRYSMRPCIPESEGTVLRLLFAGRLAPQKGVETALKALASPQLRAREEVTLTLVGSGSLLYERQLKELIAELKLVDRVKLVGRVPREMMPLVFQQFEVMVVPSNWEEPLARVVLEGMASGLVVVASRKGGTPEMIADGVNGLLFEPDDSDDLAEKLVSLLRNPALRCDLTQAARRTIEESFTLSGMTDKVEAFLEESLQLAENAVSATEPGAEICEGASG